MRATACCVHDHMYVRGVVSTREHFVRFYKNLFMQRCMHAHMII